ncbi:hypothetical protein OXX59_005228 [Metschnikowia pulcherrima]
MGSSRKYDEIDLRRIPAGTIKIDCSGAYIANDHLIRGNVSLSSTPSPSPPTSDESSSDEEETPIKDAKNANITLPKHNSEVIHISVDIGGTLTKLVYFTASSATGKRAGGNLHFRDFQTGSFEDEALQFMIQLVRESMSKKHCPPITYIISTGGGAHKFSKLMTSTFAKNKLPMQIVKKDEMECLIKGLDWLITKIPNEIFTYDLEKDNIRFNTSPVTEKDIYPYLLVNIGSGVSMIKVTGPGPSGFERIGGSSLGGGTLWGLLSLLTDAQDYNEMLEMAQRGDNENIDLLVGDIYGTSYNKIGLKSNHIASSFAKVFKKLRFNQSGKKLTTAEKLANFRQEDIARSLLYSVSNNIGQIAYLQARRFGLKRIYFGGSYISGHMQTIHTLSYASNFWSNGEMQSYFLRHEGYLGSVGAFMMGPNGVKPSNGTA